MPHERLATMADAEYLSTRLRQSDLMELRAGSGSTPLEALTLGLQLSEPPLVAVTDDDRPLFMFGAGSIEPGLVGCIWLLGTDEMLQHRVWFVRRMRKWAKAFNDRWPILCNYVDERNEVHIKWLQSIDCTFIARHPNFGVEKRPFLEFVKVKKCVN
jgi:hypothetical protein